MLGYDGTNVTVVRLLWRGLLGGGLLGGRSLADIFLDHNLHWLFIGAG